MEGRRPASQIRKGREERAGSQCYSPGAGRERYERKGWKGWGDPQGCGEGEREGMEGWRIAGGPGEQLPLRSQVRCRGRVAMPLPNRMTGEALTTEG
jgi:hypothetical protein